MMDTYNIEKLAFDLAMEFRKHYIKYSFRIYKKTGIKNSKWWNHFLKTAEKYIEYEDFNPKEFVSVVFRNYGKVLPFFLHGKKAEEIYKDNYFKEDSDSEKIISQVLGSKKTIDNWCLKNKKEVKDYFCSDNPFILKRKAEYISPFYLAFSKSFLSNYAKIDNKEEVIPKKELSNKRALAKVDNSVSYEIRQILKDDFI